MEKDIAELIGEISKVSNIINMQGKHTVFINDMGHVQQFSIKVHKNGWKEYSYPTLSQDVYYSDDETTEEEKLKFQKDVLNKLKVVRDTLYKLLKNDQVSMKNRGCDVEEIRHYKFY